MTRPTDQSVANQLVEMAHQRFRFGQNTDGEPFAVPNLGAHVAMLIGSQEEGDFRAYLAKEYRQLHRKVPSKAQLTDAIQVLTGECLDAAPEPCFRRVAPCCDGGVAVDLGRSDGKTVIIYPNGPKRWSLVERSPVLFHRSPLMGEMPVPVEGSSLDEIPKLMRLQDKNWGLLLGWILAAYERDIPHPILAIFGPAGAGKSFLAKLAVRLTDPSPCPLRSAPNTEEQWQLTAASSWVSAMDNVSDLKPWLADALCKAATGDARAVRRLYSAKGLTVTSLKVPVILTAIEVGSLRSDFGDRLVMLELPRRDGDAFAQERELEASIQQRLPFWLGALFDAVSRVMEQKPMTRPPEQRSRMADFGHVLACGDAAGVTWGVYAAYMQNRQDTVQEVAEGDELVDAVSGLLHKTTGGHWQGSATELLRALDPHKPCDKPPGWPRAPNRLSERLKRLESVLKGCGVRYAAHRKSDTRQKLISLSFSKKEKPSSVSSAQCRSFSETRDMAMNSPDDTGAIPGRYPNDGRTELAASPVDPRTITERCAPNCDPCVVASRDPVFDLLQRPTQTDSDLKACPRCRSQNLIDVPIHGGSSARRDCADCNAFVAFTRWQTAPITPGNSLRSAT